MHAMRSVIWLLSSAMLLGIGGCGGAVDSDGGNQPADLAPIFDGDNVRVDGGHDDAQVYIDGAAADLAQALDAEAADSAQTVDAAQADATQVADASTGDSALTQYVLGLSVVGTGTIALDPPGGTYASGTVVGVTANPAQGWSFSQWSGHLSGNLNPTSITMNGNKAITATFVEGCANPSNSCSSTPDRSNRAICSAHAVTLSSPGSQAVSDAYCNGATYWNWYKLTVPANALVTITPNVTTNWQFKVFTGPSDAVALGQLTEVSHAFLGADRWKYVFPGSGNVTAYVAVFGVQNQAYTLTFALTSTTYLVGDSRITGPGAEYAFMGGLPVNYDTTIDHDYTHEKGGPGVPGTGFTQGCIKEYVNPANPGLGWKTMKVVRAVANSLVVAYDCKTDFPEWTAEKIALYGELRCDYSGHPGRELWCQPSGTGTAPQAKKYLGLCELMHADHGEAVCLTDRQTDEAHSRYIFGCQSNWGWLFDSDVTLFNSYNVSEGGGYPMGLDCRSAFDSGNRVRSDAEAARGKCGMFHLLGEKRCLFDREQFLNLEPAEPDYAANPPSPNDFPTTQNLISNFNLGPGNGIPYVLLDAMSGILSDADLKAAQPQIEAAAARGIPYLGYFDWGAYAAKTGWGPGWQGNFAGWYTAGYLYGYWRDKLADDVGDASPAWKLPAADNSFIKNACWDSDGDLRDNLSDNCPKLSNASQTDNDADSIGNGCDPTPDTFNDDPDSDGRSARDVNADRMSDDNCPLASNADQTDTDWDGIGDACVPVATCDPTISVACIDVDNQPAARAVPMTWAWDIARPVTQALATAQAKLLVNAGGRGATYDMAQMGDCFAPETLTLFDGYLDNCGSLEQSLCASGDSNHAARKRIAALAHSAMGANNVRQFAASYGEGWKDYTDVGHAWALFKIDVVRQYMKTFRDDMNAYTTSLGKPGFITFMNQGENNLFDTYLDGTTIKKLKDIAGSETMIGSQHPTLGYNECAPGSDKAGTAYPVNRTLEMVHALSDTDGLLRFWSWNAPWDQPDDRMLLFAAEVIANGGILEEFGPAAEFYFPLDGYIRPGVVMRMVQSPVAPWMTKQWGLFNGPRVRGQIAYYAPQLPGGGLGASAEQLYRTLLSLHYTVDVLGRGPFDLGVARLPTVEELNGYAYDFIVLSSDRLSDEEVAVLKSYVHGGGKLVVMGTAVGNNDEWGRNVHAERDGSVWLGYFQNHGCTPYGTGTFCQLDGDATAWNGRQASQAFDELARPNQQYALCKNADGTTIHESGSLVVADVTAARDQLATWLKTHVQTNFGLASPELGDTLPRDVHVVRRARLGDAKPVYHLVNYALTAVPYAPYLYGERAGPGNFESLTINFGCTVPQDIATLVVPVPPELQAAGGTVTMVSLDYETPEATFFPNQTNPDSPCAATYLKDAFPAPANNWTYPTWTFTYPPGDPTVTLAGVKMKEWSILYFE